MSTGTRRPDAGGFVVDHGEVPDDQGQQRPDERDVDGHVRQQRQGRLEIERVRRSRLAVSGEELGSVAVDPDDRVVTGPPDDPGKDGHGEQTHHGRDQDPLAAQ